MICARCGHPIEEAPCAGCGGSPWLDGRYALERTLEDGPGYVRWLAVLQVDGTVVEVCELRLHAGLSALQRAALVEDASALRDVQHPGLAVCLDVFEGRSGPHPALFVVWEHVVGLGLDQVLADGRPPREEALRTLDEITSILSALHGREPPLGHGDLRPANIIRRARDGRLVLTHPVPPGLVERGASVRFGADREPGVGVDLSALADVAQALLHPEAQAEALELMESLRVRPEDSPHTADRALAQLRALRGVGPTGDEASPFEETQAMPVFSDEETLRMVPGYAPWVIGGLVGMVVGLAGALAWFYLL